MNITAYNIPDAEPMPLVPATRKRSFDHDIKGITLCLPLQIASQWGWWLINPVGFNVYRVVGGDIELYTEDGDTPTHVASHFGFGVLSVMVPYVFRTPPGWNTMLRGPSNYIKWGAFPFEGIVESSWNNTSALMNWYIEENKFVHFEAGEPLCQIVPVPDNIEAWNPSISNMPPDMERDFLAWRENRIQTFAKVDATGKPNYELGYREKATNTKLNMSPWSSG